VTEQRGASARFLRSEATGSILLLICTVTAIVWANSPWSASYFRLLHTKIAISWNSRTFALTWVEWINNGLMALFFFVVGLEVKREIVVGHLSTWKNAIVPVAAAVGGMLVPALIYTAVNHGREAAGGWAIAMATDLEAVIGILALLGARVPLELKIFFTAMAISDDIGAVLDIAILHTYSFSPGLLIAACGFVGLLVAAAWLKVHRTAVYAVLAIGVWFSVFGSGVNATVAGILIALVVPVRSRVQPEHLIATARERLAELEANPPGDTPATLTARQIETVEELQQAAGAVIPAGPALEHYLHPVAAFGILPLFALVNTGIVLDTSILKALAHPAGLGVLLGLVLGKQAGIMAAAWLVIRTRLAEMPRGITWRQIYGIAVLAGVGFSIALFVSDLAIDNEQLMGYSRAGILTASAICAVAGYCILRRSALK
jgi:NhaA family Na+:H+ antiporter